MKTSQTKTNQILRVTEVGEFIRHRSCQRRFKLGYDNQAEFKKLPLADQPYQTMDPVLALMGEQRELDWALHLEALGLVDLREDMDLTDDEAESKGVSWARFCEALADLNSGQEAFAREVEIEGVVGAFELKGRVDFIVIRWEESLPQIWIVECKASRRDRTYHRLQVVLYRMILQRILAEDGSLQIGPHSVDVADFTTAVVRIDEETERMISLGDLRPIPQTEQLAMDALHLLEEGGMLDGILKEPLEDLPFQLDGKCDDCTFNIHCFAESARQRRLELLGVAPDILRALREHGVTTIDALAELDMEDVVARCLREDTDFYADVERLILEARARRSTLPKLSTQTQVDSAEDEENTRTRGYNVERSDHDWSGHLPRHDVRVNDEDDTKHELVRVFLSVSYDYSENRVGALAAHVVGDTWDLCTPFEEVEGAAYPQPSSTLRERRVEWESYEDEEKKMKWRRAVCEERENRRGASIVHIKGAPWSSQYDAATGAEQNLLEGFFNELVSTIEGLTQERDAFPIHFYVWSESEMTRLLEAASRVGGGMLRHLRELFGCREKLEQLIYSSLEKEIHQRFSLGWTSEGLVVASSLRWFGERFHWRREHFGRDVELDKIFNRDLFDFRSNLPTLPNGTWASEKDPDSKKSWHRYEVRSRFYDNLSAPYWRAKWRTLPDPGAAKYADDPRIQKMKKPLEDYRAAGRGKLLELYLEARVEAMRWLEERVGSYNTSIIKPLMTRDELPNFELATTSIPQAAVDFLRLDQHVKYTQWLLANLIPSHVRVTEGGCLPLRDLEQLDSRGMEFRATLDYTRYGMSASNMETRTSLSAGSFVRVHQADPNPAKGQTVRQLTYGKTCVIEEIDWSVGEATFSIVPAYQDSFYTVPSFPFSEDYPIDDWTHATADESITDYVAPRVEKRLEAVIAGNVSPPNADHVFAWFDPELPKIDALPELDDELRDHLVRLLDVFEINGDGDKLLPSRRELILGGLTARIQLIQGPPGTGKTMVGAVAILIRILTNYTPNSMILLSAHTHNAVETLLNRVARIYDAFCQATEAVGLTPPAIAMLKMGGSNTDGEQSTLDNNIEVVEDIPSPSQFKLGLIKPSVKDQVAVIGGTTAGLLKMFEGLEKKNFSWCRKNLAHGLSTPLLVVDEASMMVCAHFMALATLLHEDGSILLAGDHRQLSPIVAHDWESEDRPPAQRFRMHQSAFEAIVGLLEPDEQARQLRMRPLPEGTVRRDNLVHTYRLPPAVRHLIQPLYALDGIELVGPSTTTTPALAPGRSPLEQIWCSKHSIYLVLHNEHSSRKVNPLESALIERILDIGQALGNLRDDSTAVLTPHRAQRARLRHDLAAYDNAVSVIDTVERLQGNEQDTILFSATASDPVAIAQITEFILNMQRSNVAFSRTKTRLVVVCARTLLDHVPAELEHYETALLWKFLRSFCRHQVGTDTMDEHTYEVLVHDRFTENI